MTSAGSTPTDDAGHPITAAAGPKPLRPDAESTNVLRDFQNSLPPELQEKTPNFGTTPVDRNQLSALVAQAHGNPDEFNAALKNLAGPDPKVSSTPVVLRDGNGNTGTSNLFQVKGADGKNYLMDSQGAHYTDFDDYLRNNPLPEGLTVTRPADLGDPTGDAGSLITSPAHPATGFWPTIEKGGKWLTATGKSLREQGSALNSETPTLSTGLGSGLNSAGAGLEFLGSIVTGVSSGEDLTSRVRHGQGIALDDPRAQADYLNVLSGASNVAAVFGGAAGADGREAAAIAAARGASVLAAPGVGNQAGQLYQD
ncbi:hypothetical protein [Pseudonocardia spinosispora]|uniref:hypothetical protein n=1 Tax=Pseudonocardia spinosispora TaxID=103441 RepID=UPI00048A8295|nr:hypothetical protein [Pseudonocardia spinosispora]